MRPTSPTRTLQIAIIGITLLAGLTAACAPVSAPDAAASPTSEATLGPSIGSQPSDPAPSRAGRDAPPDAALAAEGGEPAIGQLGTYLWLQTGSDAPWLLGAPLKVGSGEPLRVAFDPGIGVDAWMARFVPAATQGPEGARPLGEGVGKPAFPAPDAGDWSVHLFVRFAGGAGEANYFWHLQVE